MVTQLSGRFIPAEIIDTIIDLVSRSGADGYPDPAELGRLALVQKAWAGRCQHHLFASVSLTSPERGAALARLLAVCPQLGQHVRSLRVAEIVPARNACQSDPALFWVAQSAELRCVLAALPNLNTLRLGAVGLGTAAALLAPGGTRCAGVTTLELENVTLNGVANLRAYVCAFPALRTLVLDECTTLALAPCDAAREVPGWAAELEDASWAHAGVERLRLLSFGAEDAPVQVPVLRAVFPGVRALEIGVSDECDVDLAGALAALYGAQLAELALDAAQWQAPERSGLPLPSAPAPRRRSRAPQSSSRSASISHRARACARCAWARCVSSTARTRTGSCRCWRGCARPRSRASSWSSRRPCTRASSIRTRTPRTRSTWTRWAGWTSIACSHTTARSRRWPSASRCRRAGRIRPRSTGAARSSAASHTRVTSWR
jgi:hypothetical protein